MYHGGGVVLAEGVVVECYLAAQTEGEGALDGDVVVCRCGGLYVVVHAFGGGEVVVVGGVEAFLPVDVADGCFELSAFGGVHGVVEPVALYVCRGLQQQVLALVFVFGAVVDLVALVVAVYQVAAADGDFGFGTAEYGEP